MLNLKIDKAKSKFFDRQIVIDAVNKAERRSLSKIGAYIRTAARSSIRYRKKPSPPGSPPSAHRTMTRRRINKKGQTKIQSVSPLREFIFFAYDQENNSVIAGPALLNGQAGAKILMALEMGGTSEIIARDGKKISITLKPRPFMKPALDKALADILRKSLTDSVKK